MNTTSADNRDPWLDAQLRNTKQLAAWTFGWVLSVALATFGPLVIWGDQPALSFGAFALQIALGIGMILANKKNLLGLDELHQRIHLNAMGITLGVALVGGIAYEGLYTTELLTGTARISVLIGALGLTYLVAMMLGMRAYR